MDSPRYSVFAGTNHVVSGPLETVLPVLKQHFDRDPGAPCWCSMIAPAARWISISAGRCRKFSPAPCRRGPGLDRDAQSWA